MATLTLALTAQDFVLLQKLSKINLGYSLTQALANRNNTPEEQWASIWMLFVNYEAYTDVIRWEAGDDVRAYRQVTATMLFITRCLIERFPFYPGVENMPQTALAVKQLGPGITDAVNRALDTTTKQPFLPIDTYEIKAKA